MNKRKVSKVAKAICWAAGNNNLNGNKCPVCEGTNSSMCTMEEQFANEAIAAINAMKSI